MRSSQSKRLEKLEEKTRTQWEEAKVKYWNEILALMSQHERQDAQDCIVKWYTSAPECRMDEVSIRQHFTEPEIDMLRCIDVIAMQPRFATMRECIGALYDALQACERVRE